MIESEVKLTIPPHLIEHQCFNHVMSWALPLMQHHKFVFQTDSFRESDREGYILRMRSHEDTGQIIMGYKEQAQIGTGLMCREELEYVISTGHSKKNIHQQVRRVLPKHEEFAYSGIKRTLCRIAEGHNSAELCIDSGWIFGPDGAKRARVSEVELESKEGSLRWLEDKAHELRSYIYECTGYRMAPAPSKGRLAVITAHAPTPSL